jgi:hypothetical protein
MNRAKTQRDQILGLLIRAHGEWVPLPEVMQHAAQYGARIHELRRMGFTIENRIETVNGDRHSWFRLVSAPCLHRAAPVSVSTVVDVQQMSLVTLEQCHRDEG